jgi:hypothetical protein
MRLQLRVVNNSIGGVVVSALAAGTVDRGFEFRASQTKDYKIYICCFSVMYAGLLNKNWLIRIPDDVPE